MKVSSKSMFHQIYFMGESLFWLGCPKTQDLELHKYYQLNQWSVLHSSLYNITHIQINIVIKAYFDKLTDNHTFLEAIRRQVIASRGRQLSVTGTEARNLSNRLTERWSVSRLNLKCPIAFIMCVNITSPLITFVIWSDECYNLNQPCYNQPFNIRWAPQYLVEQIMFWGMMGVYFWNGS